MEQSVSWVFVVSSLWFVCVIDRCTSWKMSFICRTERKTLFECCLYICWWNLVNFLYKNDCHKLVTRLDQNSMENLFSDLGSAWSRVENLPRESNLYWKTLYYFFRLRWCIVCRNGTECQLSFCCQLVMICMCDW